MRPMPLRTRVGAMCEMRPPAPIHSTLLLEKISWSKPASLRWRSSAPATAFPRSLIEVCETVDARCMFFSSFPVDFDFQALLKIFVSAGRVGGIGAVARVTVEVGQQPMLEPLQLDEQAVGRASVARHSHHGALLVGKLGPLVQHQHAFNLRPGDKEELLIPVSGSEIEALVQEEGADRIATESGVRPGGGLGLDSVEALQELVDPLNLPLQARRSFAPSRGLSEARNQVFTPIHKRGSLFFQMCRFHCS